MPNYNAKENSNNFGGLGPKKAGQLGGRKKGENRRKRMQEMEKKEKKEKKQEESAK